MVHKTTSDDFKTWRPLHAHCDLRLRRRHHVSLGGAAARIRQVSRLTPDPGWHTGLWSSSGTIFEGYQVRPVGGVEVAENADMVVVPSWPEHTPRIDDELAGVLRRAHDCGATIVGLCLGALAVADAGLLAGRSAVTHWAAIKDLRDRHRDVHVNSLVLYVDHGDVITSAGTASAIDACLHIVCERLGAETANRVARRLVVAPHRTAPHRGQAQYIEHALPPLASKDLISPEVVNLSETDWCCWY